MSCSKSWKLVKAYFGNLVTKIHQQYRGGRGNRCLQPTSARVGNKLGSKKITTKVTSINTSLGKFKGTVNAIIKYIRPIIEPSSFAPHTRLKKHFFSCTIPLMLSLHVGRFFVYFHFDCLHGCLQKQRKVKNNTYQRKKIPEKRVRP